MAVTRPVLFWDFDGTLATAGSLWNGSAWRVLTDARPDLNVPIEAIRPHMRTGFPWHNTEVDRTDRTDPEAWWGHLEAKFAEMYTHLGATPEEAHRLAPRIRMNVTRSDAYTLDSETRPVLEELRRRGYTHHILSNHVPELEAIIRALGIRDLFLGCTVSARVGWDKPNPQLFQAARKAAGHPDPCFMIGDNPVADIDGAARTGIPGIWMKEHSHDSTYPDGLCPPVFTCARLTDILEFLPDVGSRTDI